MPPTNPILAAPVVATRTRTVTQLVMHCTAGPQNQSVQTILNYWRESNGWGSVPGYHYLISADGKVHKLAPESQATYGVKGHNAHSIHVSYIGGVDRKGFAVDNRTPAQIAAQIRLIHDLKARYPKARIVGHRDFAGVTKKCPSYDVATWLRSTPELAKYA